MKGKIYFIIFFILLTQSLHAQNSSLDSFLLSHEQEHDTVKIDLLLDEYFPRYTRGVVLDGEQCLNKALEIAEKCKCMWRKGRVLLKYGDYYKISGDYGQAVDYYLEAQKIFNGLNKEKALGTVYNNLGATYESMGEYDEAMANLMEALSIYESVNDSMSIARTFVNLGLLYFRQEEYDKSLEFYNRSLQLKQSLSDQEGIALLYNNIAIVNYYTENYDSVRYYFQKAYNIYKREGNKRSQVMALSNLAEIYNVLGQKDKALESYFNVLKLEKEMGEKAQVAKTYFLIGNLYYNREEIQKAKSYFLQSLSTAKELNALVDIKDACYSLAALYKEENDYESALEYFELYHIYNDSIFNAEKSKQIKEIETKYETRKKEQRIKNLENEKIIRDLRIKKQQFFILSFVLGLLVISTFLLILFNRNKKIRLAKDKLTYQKKQITDSIEYASRIQNAILPPNDYICQLIPENFIFYKPRDIVSGDFYWVTEKNNKIVLAVIDCTGHGVPGAFMSMLGAAFLNEIVNTDDEQKANTILNQLRDRIKKSLHQTGRDSEMKDGMDISLCILDQQNGIIQFAGAYNSLFLISNHQPTTIKGDRMPIGIYLNEKKSFTNHEIKVQPGDMLYMFTDGYIDQFGGKDKRKFRIAPFRKMLVSIHEKPMDEQKQILEKEFYQWKGSMEQIDDVLVFGFRI
ncbi:MAG: tetratricopeptide repeat protein [Bacteroidales bacterium]|jgi:serine phosphatase RsbU (regulator of sigma subunit)/Tfp pilus assembly protein PilF|nr:tetratricopeptide repeat protein [Bacteroidales bacterium]